MEKKYIPKSKVIKALEDLGYTDIELTQHKSEGWWLSSNQFDDWLAMDSYGCILRIKREFKTVV